MHLCSSTWVCWLQHTLCAGDRCYKRWPHSCAFLVSRWQEPCHCLCKQGSSMSKEEHGELQQREAWTSGSEVSLRSSGISFVHTSQCTHTSILWPTSGHRSYCKLFNKDGLMPWQGTSSQSGTGQESTTLMLMACPGDHRTLSPQMKFPATWHLFLVHSTLPTLAEDNPGSRATTGVRTTSSTTHWGWAPLNIVWRHSCWNHTASAVETVMFVDTALSKRQYNAKFALCHVMIADDLVTSGPKGISGHDYNYIYMCVCKKYAFLFSKSHLDLCVETFVQGK